MYTINDDSNIPTFWQEKAKELGVKRLKHFTNQGSNWTRPIMIDMLKHSDAMPLLQDKSLVEIGGLFDPLSLLITKNLPKTATLIVDPAYAENRFPECTESQVEFVAGTLEQHVGTIDRWVAQHGDTVLILENIINYVPARYIKNLLQNPNIKTLLIGNNSTYTWGEMHSERLKSPDEIMKAITIEGFNIKNNKPFYLVDEHIVLIATR